MPSSLQQTSCAILRALAFVAAAACLAACAGAPVGSSIALGGPSGDDAAEHAGRMATRITHGPLLGELDDRGMQVWVRLDGEPGDQVALEVLDAQGAALAQRLEASAAERRTPRTLVWSVRDLVPSSMHRYRITGVAGGPSRSPDGFDGTIRMRAADAPSATLAIGSCADEKEGTQALLKRIASLHPDAVAFIGDTPYIDTTDLARQRKRYGEFFSQPGMAEWLSSTPLAAVWDDHDFGLNDTDGRLKGKERSLQAFREWHANASFGTGTEGVYHRLRLGPMEVFMLDTRWFARTARCSAADAADPVIEGTADAATAGGWTLLGREQWAWLQDGLRASTAPIKLIVSSMVFNSSVRPLKTDYWGMYPEEYARLMRMVRDVPGGVVLVSGDVHTSRLLLHPTQASAGRDLWEVVSSPMHAGVHDSSLWSRSDWVKEHFPHPNMMALFTARQEGGVATLGVRFVDKDGAVFMDRELVRVQSNARAIVIEAAADREDLHRLRRVIEPWFMDGERPAPAAGSLAGQRAEATATIEALRALLGPAPGACRLEPVGDGTTLMTAYASPRVRESVSGDARSAFFTRPAWLPPGGEGPTRAQWLAAASADAQAHPVLAYGDDAFNVYMAAVNGSVQLERADGTMRCLVHDGTNERPYTSLATSLVDRGALAAEGATLDGLRALWGREPAVVQAACDGNERFVWWREVPCDQWPQSPFGMRLLAGQAAAVDASVIPIGSLLLLVPEPVDASLPPELRAPRIVYAADCGGAIRGAERIDLYLGAGDDALATAGRVKARVRVYRISAQ
jgi:alkaline phosphatase D